MKQLDHIRGLPKAPVHEDLVGLTSMVKVFVPDGTSAFLTLSDLDLDTDGARIPGVHYESTHQNTTSLGEWVNSNNINFIVMPIGLSERHGDSLGMGTLATVIYSGRVAHAVVGDLGPKGKYGEGSIDLHRALGFERIKPNGHIQDVGIDNGVLMLIYLGHHIGGKFTQADIDAACAPLWTKFTS